MSAAIELAGGAAPADYRIIIPPRCGELARFSREFPHNRFRVAPTGEAAVSDAASASGLVSVGP